MSVVSLLGIKVMNNPAKFTDPYHFVITFECLEPLEEDFECKLTYVGSANSDRWDQELEANSVGPIPTGVHNFEFKPPAPDLKKLHEPDILGVTVILLTCSYKGREFVRVGYYVNNEYDSEELINAPPAKVNIERVKRNILSEKPRVTRFAIKWDSEASAPAEYPPEQPEAEIVADGDQYGAEEEAEEAELEKQAAAEEGDDSEMAGVENENSEAKAQNGQTDEGNLSDKGSVDLEGESSEDEFEEEEEEGAEDASKAQGGDDAMDVDMADSKPAGAQANNPVSVAI